MKNILLSVIFGAFVFAGSNVYACDCQKGDDTKKTADAKAGKEDKKACACKRKTKDQAAEKAGEATPCGCNKKDA